MEKTKSQPFFIELIDQATLKNKFKFVLDPQTVKELKSQIKEKLIAKQEIQKETEIVLKDNDDFQLASDDEIKDVLPDCKVKIYIKNNQPSSQLSNQPNSQAPSVQSTTNSIPAQVNQNILPPVVVKQTVVKNLILDITKITQPKVPQNCKMILQAYCLQIRQTCFDIPLPITIKTHYQLNSHLKSIFNLPNDLKIFLCNKYGQPYLQNLDLMHLCLPKLDLSEVYHLVITVSASTVDEAVPEPLKSNTPVKLTVEKDKQSFKIQIDLDHSITQAKLHIFQSTGIHPANQILKFNKVPLNDANASLRSLGIKENETLLLSFKNIANLLPCTFADKFYYKDINHIRPQSEESIVELRSTLLTLTAHLSTDDKKKLCTWIRGYSLNMPLVFALKSLLNNNFVSQTYRIALEEGFMLCLCQYIRKCTPQLDTQYKNIFLHFRNFIGFALEGMKKIMNLQELKLTESVVQIQTNCHFTMQPIKIPRLIKLDNGQIVVVDKQLMSDQIKKGFTFPLLTGPKIQQLYTTKDLDQIFIQYLINQIDNTGTNAIYWIGFSQVHPKIQIPPISTPELYRPTLEAYPNLKIHQPLEVKNKVETYLLLKNKQGHLKVFISKSKDIAKPYNIFDVFSGTETGVNLDLLGANVKTENVEETVDISNLKPVITRDPKEAIAILFDVSGSMGSLFFNEPDLRRIGAVKSFFEAFAYRTIAYNLEHVVSLFFFDHTVQNQCDFTEAIYDFNRLVSQATPRGSTLMYDAIMTAVTSLKNFKKNYPDCILRIIALTDGQDTGSSVSVNEATKIIIDNGIIIDSFAVGANCQGLKTISKASGGRCYLTKNLEESLKLFEQQTVLSVRARKDQHQHEGLTVEQRINLANSAPFDLPSSVHAFSMPEVKGGLSARQILKKLEGAQQTKKISGSNNLKRIAKEIHHYSENPHPFVAIFPSSDITLWKILLLGPKQTPYEGGLFFLYAQFPNEYPFKAPTVRFITPIYHCNMNSQGRICHSVFDRNYSPAITFRQIIDCVYGLILTPEPEDPLDNVVASYYLSDYQTYLKNAKQFTKQKASPSNEKIVEELYGKINDDGQRKKKQAEIGEWIEKAKLANEAK